jgi:hypothetical protein
LGTIIEQLPDLAAYKISLEQRRESLRHLRSLLNMANGVKLYDFMAESKWEQRLYACFRNIPKPSLAKAEAQLRVGQGILMALAEYWTVPGFKATLGLDPDSKKLTATLFFLLRRLKNTSADPSQDLDDEVVGSRIALTRHTSASAPAAGCHAYEEIGLLVDGAPGHIVDVKA